jgi:hypothetical protein
MLLILRPTAMPRTARSAALLDMSASTDSGRTSQAGDPNNLANAIHAKACILKSEPSMLLSTSWTN